MTSSLARRTLLLLSEPVVNRSLRDLADAGDAHDGTPWSLAVRAPVRLPSLDAEIVLSRETIARLSAAPPPAGASALAVHWQPAGGASFPTFDGRLWCEADTTDSSWLHLEGCYETLDERLRVAERGERTIGHRIALATAKAFLDQVAESIRRLRAA